MPFLRFLVFKIFLYWDKHEKPDTNETIIGLRWSKISLKKTNPPNLNWNSPVSTRFQDMGTAEKQQLLWGAWDSHKDWHPCCCGHEGIDFIDRDDGKSEKLGLLLCLYNHWSWAYTVFFPPGSSVEERVNESKQGKKETLWGNRRTLLKTTYYYKKVAHVMVIYWMCFFN